MVPPAVNLQTKVAEALIAADGYIHGLKSVAPGSRVQYMKLAEAAIDVLRDAPSYKDIGQPCAGYECDGHTDMCADCGHSVDDYHQTMRSAMS